MWKYCEPNPGGRKGLGIANIQCGSTVEPNPGGRKGLGMRHITYSSVEVL